MYVIFIILLLNYENTVHAHNYRFFWKGLCFNYPISTLSPLHMHENVSKTFENVTNVLTNLRKKLTKLI